MSGTGDEPPIDEAAFVFNIVWTGSVFGYLRYFVASQIRHSGARFRFVLNGCVPGQAEMMERFAQRFPDRVVEIYHFSDDMLAHGVALDAVFRTRDDGDYFCLIDSDIKARAPFVAPFAQALRSGCDGVTSGRGVWNDDVVVPRGHLGVPGECFYSPDGYLFGSPHFGMYRRAALTETMERWGVGFGSAGREIPAAAAAAIEAAGHRYWIYDTGKILNILFQEGGHRLCHFEHDSLVHVGGMSHYLSPPEHHGKPGSANEEPDQKWPWPAARLEVARYSAALLRDLCAYRPPPPMPPGLPDDLAQRLRVVRDELIDLVHTYDDDVREHPAPKRTVMSAWARTRTGVARAAARWRRPARRGPA